VLPVPGLTVPAFGWGTLMFGTNSLTEKIRRSRRIWTITLGYLCSWQVVSGGLVAEREQGHCSGSDKFTTET
jgi:hypothetical protein